jgi:hypothetical protein
MDFQKGAALYEEDSRNRCDESFSDKSHGSKTTNATSPTTAIYDAANTAGVELVAGRCCSRSKAWKYDNRWLICTGPITCKRMGHMEKREKGNLGKPVLYVAIYNKGGNHKFGVLEDTLMSEKEARERA